MTWYLFIILGLFATIMAYRKKAALRRLGVQETSWLERFFGTDFGMICCASATLGIVLAFILKADPTIPQLKAMEESYENAQYRALGQRLASKVKAKANGGKALVITRAPHDVNSAQHESLMEGIKAGLGNVKVGKVEFATFLSEDKEHDKQAQPFRLSNSFVNLVLQRNPECTVVISTIGVCENFVESNLAADIASGSRAFALYNDNVYMQIYALEQSRIPPFNYCVFPNPSFDSKKSLDGQTFDFNTHYLELDLQDKKKAKATLTKHRRMFYYPKRTIIKEKGKKE